MRQRSLGILTVAEDDDWHKVFLSSTSDLEAERKEVADQAPLSFRIYRHERDSATGSRSPEARLEKVLTDGTEVFVGVYGERYGSPYPNAAENRSIVEWEFDRAAVLGLELQGHVKDPLDRSKLDPEQEEFLQRIGHFRKGKWLRRFGNPDTLTRNVNTALLEWLSKVQEREIQELQEQLLVEPPPRRRRRDQVVKALCTVGLLVSSGVGVATREWEVLGIVLAFAALVSFAGALLFDEGDLQ